MRQSLYRIASNVLVARDVFATRLDGSTDSFARAGQFVNIKIDGLYLRRPFSVADWDDAGFIIMYKVVGEGTRRLSRLPMGHELDILTGLGNGFDDTVSDAPLLIGGGVGVPPLFALAKLFVARGVAPVALLGFAAPDDIILADEMRAVGCDTIITIESEGRRVTDAVSEALTRLTAPRDCYFACGPEGMLRAIHKQVDLPGQLSLETRMACGLGLCRGCTCETVGGGARICMEGPVFDKGVLLW